MRNSKLWSGLTAVMAVLLVISLVGQYYALGYADFINSALGIQTTMVVDTGEAGQTLHYASSFGDFDDPDAQAALLAASFEQNINEMREGAVLLYNADNALPLTGEKRVSLFGHASVDPAFQSQSAGTKAVDGGLNVINLRQALEMQGLEVNAELYEGIQAGKATRSTGRVMWGGKLSSGSAAGTEENREFYEALSYTWADDYQDVAIVTLARQGSEGVDLNMRDQDDDGSVISALALHQNERDLLELVRRDFDKVIVLLNTPNQMEVHEIIPYCDAILYIGFPGHQGFVGVAEILCGTVNPSGRLVDTYATNSLSAPACVNSGTQTPEYSNAAQITNLLGSVERAERISFQAEGIYIGYRYYETRYADCVMGQGNASDRTGALLGADSWCYADEVQYTFGYGLSYTTFQQTLDSVEVGEDEITVEVTVRNTGTVAGKSVVQVYAQTPYGDYEIANKVEKSAVALAGFHKTGLLAPGEEETLTVTIDKYLLASYDYVGAKGYILSGGDYYIAIGDDAHDALNNILCAQGYTVADGMTAPGDEAKAYRFYQEFDAEKYAVSETGAAVTNQFADCDLNYWVEDAGVYLSRSDWAGTYPRKQTTVKATDAMMDILDGQWYEKSDDAPSFSEVAAEFNVDSGLTLVMMKDVPLSDRETWLRYIHQLSVEDLPYATAEGMTCPAVGDLSPSFSVGDGCDSVGGTLPFTVTVDGQEVTVPTTRYCSKPILTGTFNTELYAGRGKMMGEDALWSGFMINYSIGANLHRTPFGGRNFEYMSECPIMSYLASIPEVLAMEATGVSAAPKHFCSNDQEFNRDGVSVFFNEQAFREGVLRAFEGSLRVAKAGGLMQSYERIGLKWTSASYALNTTVLHEEWGWYGAITTDAAPPGENYQEDVGYKNHSAEVLSAGTLEWCFDGGAAHGIAVLNEAKATDDGYLLEQLTEAAIIWEYTISRSPVINGMSATAKIVQVTPWWQTALEYAALVFGGLMVLCAVMFILNRKNTGAEERGVGRWFVIASLVLGAAALAVYGVYVVNGGVKDYYVIAAALGAMLCLIFAYRGKQWPGALAGIAASALLAFALTASLGGGIGNITDAIQGIVMFGNSALANLNYWMAVLFGGSVIASVCACFAKK